MIFRAKQNLFLDHSLPPFAHETSPAGTPFPPKPDVGENCEPSIRLCQEKHAILVTADVAYTKALDSSGGGAWGVILLPADLEAQVSVLPRLSAGRLTFRPTKDSADINRVCRPKPHSARSSP
jgi:hypothetical protein